MIEKVILYEMKRAVARKKVLTLIIITLIFEIGVYVSIGEFKTPRVESLVRPIQDLLWLAGVLLPQSLLIHFIALSISSGSMSEEYEQGTVDFFLTKPITRMQFVVGKYVGGYILAVLIYSFMVILSLILSYLFFGKQVDLYYLPSIFLSVIFSILTFFSIGFMFGEVLRRSSIAFLVSSVVLIGSVIIGAVLIFVDRLTNVSTFIAIAQALPAWGGDELPFIVAQGVPGSGLIVEALEIFPTAQGTISMSVGYILVYSVVSTLLGFLSFAHRDIPKKVS
ncbi:ABC transporter permease [Acidianus sp. RZ1]|uniref:ABC transporter permease n=1 Tax=Acidianus sp. RZ1 TaxID=1540082 RepID=UPI0014917B1F|nr:ABC transporter permease [Acidianus sp. RZ1]